MFSRKTSKSLRAFSLIELLVVVAIIAVLAALVVPVARMAIENGHKAKCLGNMRTLSAGLLQYTADNNNMFPGYGWAYNCMAGVLPVDRATPPPPLKPRESGHGDVRCGLLMRGGYVTTESAFLCPAKRDIKALGYTPWGYTGRYAGCTYSINGQPAASLRRRLRRTGRDVNNLDFPLSALPTPPSGTVMLVEDSGTTRSSYIDDVSTFGHFDPDPKSNPNVDSLGTAFHAGVGNVVFFDGSARSMTSKQWREHAFDGGYEKAKQFFGGLDGFFW